MTSNLNRIGRAGKGQSLDADLVVLVREAQGHPPYTFSDGGYRPDAC